MMSREQLDRIINLLKASPVGAAATIAEMRSGFEQMAAVFPIDPSTNWRAGSEKY